VGIDDHPATVVDQAARPDGGASDGDPTARLDGVDEQAGEVHISKRVQERVELRYTPKNTL
jgi:hypothetical protein